VSQGGLDFEGLGESLLSRAREILPEILPGGRVQGVEYTCGNLRGEKGDSLKVNLQKGVWKDFASGEGVVKIATVLPTISSVTTMGVQPTRSDDPLISPA